jgi:hypothetical protein
MDGTVYALVFDNFGNLYAGGQFRSDSHSNVVRWNGSDWDSLGCGTNGDLTSLGCDDDGNVYACGEFTEAGATSTNNIAKWDGIKWNALGSGTDSAIVAMILVDSSLFVGGDFTDAAGKSSPKIAKVDVHAFASATKRNVAHPISNAVCFKLIRSTLYINGIGPNDRISLYSISGRLLQEAIGTSKMEIKACARQTLVARVSRAGSVYSTGMVFVQ